MDRINNQLTKAEIENRIYSIRGVQVMIDSDLAEMYNVEIKQINMAVKRNEERFPQKFMFQLSEAKWAILRCQNGTLKPHDALMFSNATFANNRGKHRILALCFY